MTLSAILILLAFIIVPIILGRIAFMTYMSYKRQYFERKLSYVLLEINIPRDVMKSPKAMEFVIDTLHHLGGGAMGWQNRFWDGAVLYPSSLEIVSIEGSIYFFIRCSNKLAASVKSTLYSQYPNAEINEVDDYTRYVPDYNENQDSWEVYGADFKLAKDDCLPIKTYVDYELDKNVGSLDEEQKIDPITPLLEFLGTIRSGEQVWIQFVINADPFSTWRSDAKKMIDEIMQRGQIAEEGEYVPGPQLSSGEKDTVKAIERSLAKPAFETYIRGIYIAQKDKFNGGVPGYFKGQIFKPFNSQDLNGIRKNEDTNYDWVWQDITGMRYPKLQRKFFNDYVNRTGYSPGFLEKLNIFWHTAKKPMIFTSEELATMFHIPGRVSETTALERIEATKSEPPTNLPM